MAIISWTAGVSDDVANTEKARKWVGELVDIVGEGQQGLLAREKLGYSNYGA